MLKIGVITDEISQDIRDVIKLMKKYGLKAVELRSIWDRQIFELNDEEISSLKEVFKRENIKVCAIASSVFKSHIDNKEEYDKHIKIFQRCIELSDVFETNIIRTFTFWRSDVKPSIDEICKLYLPIVEVAEKNKKYIAVENEPSVNLTNAALVKELIEKIDSEYVKALWDPANDIFEPYNEVPYPDGYEIIKDYIVHMHLKDAKKIDNEVKSVPFGEGDVDWKGQLRRLIQDGYDGYISLETHYRKRPLSEDLLNRPSGNTFSMGGYEASDECLCNLSKTLNEIGG